MPKPDGVLALRKTIESFFELKAQEKLDLFKSSVAKIQIFMAFDAVAVVRS